MKKDRVAEQGIQTKEQNFNNYIRRRSTAISDWYYDCFNIDSTCYKSAAVFGAVQIINLMGYQKGIEIGVSSGHSTITLLETCENLKTLYCVDNYKPYVDYYTENFYVDEYEINIIKNLAFKKIYSSRNKHKVVFYEEDSDLSVNRFEDGELDFAFLDAHLNAEQVKNDLEKWYPKIKNGGLLMIHDTHFPSVLDEIKDFIKTINFDGQFSNVVDLCCLIKNN